MKENKKIIVSAIEDSAQIVEVDTVHAIVSDNSLAELEKIRCKDRE